MSTPGGIILRAGTIIPPGYATLGADDVIVYRRSGSSYYVGADGVEHDWVGVGPTRTLTAGAGLTGGGDLSANRTFDVVAADGSIVVNANSINTGTLNAIATAQPANAAVGLNSQKVSALADGTASTDAVNLGQLSAAIQGRKNKDPVKWSTTGNIALTGLGTQANGEWVAPLTAGDRILAKDQTTSADKGIYVAAAGAWTRATDADTGAEITEASTLILNGATLTGDTFTQTATVTTIGTDPQTWTQTGEGATLTADGSTLQLVGLTLSEKDGGTTNAKLANMAALTVKGSVAGGVPADLTPAQITTNFVVPDGSTIEISANQVRVKDGGITNAKLANKTAPIFLGRTTAGLGAIEDLTVTQATAMLNTATIALKGLLAPLDKQKLDYLPNLVTDYGADPTGTTDIAAAVTAAVAAGVSRVFVPAGTYKCATAGPNIITTHLLFVGAGRKDTIFKTNHATNTAFQFRNWGGGFEECGFDTLVARTGGYAIDMPNSTQAGAGSGSVYCIVRRCDIYAQFIAVHSGDHEQLFDDIEVRFPGLSVSGQGGFLMDGAAVANDKRLSNILIQGGNAAGQFGVRATQAASLTLTGRNDFINCANAFDLIPGNGQSIPSVYVINTFFDNSIIGVNIAPTGTGAVLRCHFTQSWFSSCTTAGLRLNSANIAGIDLVNCDVFGNAIGIEALAAQDWSVMKSRFAGNTTAGIQTTAGATHGFSIAFNTFGTVASPQFGVNAKSINIQAGTYARYEVFENRGTETDTSGITDAGAVTLPAEKFVRDNPGTGANEYNVRHTATQLVNSTALADLTGLSFPIVQPNLTYAFDGVIIANITGTTAATGLQLAINAPAGATIQANISSAASSTLNKETYFTQINTAQTGIVTASATTVGVRVAGVIIAGTATSHTGTVQLRAAVQSGTASTIAGSATINLGGWLRASRL